MKKNWVRKVVAVGTLMALSMTSVVMAAVNQLVPSFAFERFTMKLGTSQSVTSILYGTEVDVSKLTTSNPTVVKIENNTLKAVGTGITTLRYTYDTEEGSNSISCYIEVARSSTASNGTSTAQLTITLDLGEYTATMENGLGAVVHFPDVTRDGYVLEGWYQDAIFTKKVTENMRVNRDTTFYAKWITIEEANALIEAGRPHSSLYDDIDNHWARNEIESVTYLGLFQGVSEKMFGPDQSMTRAMAITALGRLEGIEKTGRTTDFTDVLSGSYYEEYVAWGVENHIVAGTSETEFSPKKAITRQEMAIMMANYIQYKGFDYEIQELYYSDAEDISDWAKESVQICSALGIMEGNSDGTYLPRKVATRAEIATVFFNYMNYINR